MSDSMASRQGKSDAAFRTISEVALELDVPQHVLRFWESKFNQVRPLKRGGGRRYYRPEDITLLKRIRVLLYDDGLTIKGVQKLFKEHGLKAVLETQKGPMAIMEQSATSDDKTGDETLDKAALLVELRSLKSVLMSALSPK